MQAESTFYVFNILNNSRQLIIYVQKVQNSVDSLNLLQDVLHGRICFIMMNKIFAAMIILSVICGICTGSISAVSDAAINSCVEAVELFIYLIGGMCMWGGLMRIAERSRLTEKIAAVFKPAAKILFKGLDLNGKAFHAICLNVTANLLGLGNAATPLGIEAVRALKEEEKTGDTASRNMIVFTVLNTASITLIPTTAASLRSKHGSAAPMEILPCVLITSAAALAVGLLTAVIFDNVGASIRRRRPPKKIKKQAISKAGSILTAPSE